MKDKNRGQALSGTEHALEASSVNPKLPDTANAAEAVAPSEGKAQLSTEPDAKPVVADMQAFIGRQLRAVYDDIARQPVPDRFLELMKQLEGTPASG